MSLGFVDVEPRGQVGDIDGFPHGPLTLNAQLVVRLHEGFHVAGQEDFGQAVDIRLGLGCVPVVGVHHLIIDSSQEQLP